MSRTTTDLGAFEEPPAELELSESLRAIDRGIEDMKAGRGRPLKEAVREIAEELGLRLER